MPNAPWPLRVCIWLFCLLLPTPHNPQLIRGKPEGREGNRKFEILYIGGGSDAGLKKKWEFRGKDNCRNLLEILVADSILRCRIRKQMKLTARFLARRLEERQQWNKMGELWWAAGVESRQWEQIERAALWQMACKRHCLSVSWKGGLGNIRNPRNAC